MRPILLEIEGLQSFRDIQRIDFGCLGETGLFGIFGPTGSGKSTVLDAVTFALYGKVNRADRGTQGIINASLGSVKVSFTFELLKNRIRKTYRVERVYGRKRNSENSCEPKIVRLFEVNEAVDIPLCDKATEVNGKIEELLGLNHDDFTRAVVLPQNKFQEFLMLENSKKREMLERIFYLEEYGGQLADKVSKKLSVLKNRISGIEGALAEVGNASQEAVMEAEQALQTALAEKSRVEKELKLLEAAHSEAREVWQLTRELEYTCQKEREYLERSEEISAKRARLEKAAKADGMQELIIKAGELSGKLNDTVKRLEDVSRRLPEIEHSLSETELECKRVKKEAENEKPGLIAMKERLLAAMEIREEIAETDAAINSLRTVYVKLKDEISAKNSSILREKQDIDAAERNIARLKSDIEGLRTDSDRRHLVQEGVKLENEVESASKNLSELRSKEELLKERVSELEQMLNAVSGQLAVVSRSIGTTEAEHANHSAAKPGEREDVMRQREAIYSLRSLLDILNMKRSELDGINSRLDGLKKSNADNMKKLQASEEERIKALEFYQHCLREVEDIRSSIDRNTAYLLSKKLKDGEPCPVCGSRDHPFPAAESDAEELSELEQQLEKARTQAAEAEKAFKEAESNCIIAGEKIKAADEQIRLTLQELELKAGQYDESRNRLPEDMRELEPESLGIEFDRLVALSAEKLKAIDEWEKTRDAYNEDIQKLNEQLSRYKMEENAIAGELKANRENLEQAGALLRDAERVYDIKRKEYLKLLEDNKITGAAAELKRITDNDRRIELLQKQMDEAQELLNGKRAAIDKLREELTGLTGKLAEVENEGKNLRNQKSEKENKLKELAGDLGIEDEIQRIDAKLLEYSGREKELEERLKGIEASYNRLCAEKATLDNQRNIYLESYETQKRHLDQALLNKGFSSIDEVGASLLPREEQELLSGEINEYERNGRNIEAQKGILLKKLNGRSMKEEEWESISNAYQEKIASKEECISVYEAARNSYNTLREKHDRWVGLNREFNDLNHKRGIYEQILKILKGDKGRDNSFIDFIAEERLRYVAAKASETLGLMTGYKYALELDANAGFIIRDNANGGVHRMVSSLSGGETFLTSLSLALALSEQIQLKGQSPLEFFFLDEGFGTLDNNLLDNVIDSLERLSKKERVIGLISHVPELKNRIARRLIVEPPTSDGQGSRVRVERA